MLSSSAIERVLESFPYQDLPPVVSQPCYETIKANHLKLNECMIYVHSNNANGMIGHLGVSEEPQLIATLSNEGWVVPVIQALLRSSQQEPRALRSQTYVRLLTKTNNIA